MLTGTNLKYTKDFNSRTVLETVRLYGPVSRADIARRTSLTAQTVSNIVGRLIDSGLIREGDKRQQGRGAPSITLKVNSDGAYSVGLDLDRDHLTGVLIDLSGDIRARRHYELDFPRPDEGLDLLTDTARDLVAEENLSFDEVSGVGVGFSGPFETSPTDDETILVSPKSFPGWDQIPVAERLRERIDCPIFLKNNATAAAIGERWYGEDHHRSTFFYLFFGIGLGGGIVIEGHPYEGSFGNAGEIGFIPTPEMLSDSESAEKSHLGKYFEVFSLYDRLEEEGHSVSTPSDLMPLYQRDNPVVEEWLDRASDHLAHIALSIEYLIDPEVIFFGGRLPDPLIQEMMDDLEERLPTLRVSGKEAAPTLKRATAGKDAAALGVATFPFYEFFAPAPHLLMKRNAKTPA